MKKLFKLRHLEKIVSVFVFLAIFFISTMAIFLAKQKKIFAKKKEFYTIINILEKISPGQEITLKGPNIPIGKITKFSITRRNRVRVDFFIYAEYEDKVRTDSVLMFSAPLFGVLGGFKVELTAGNRFYPQLEDGAMMPSNQLREGNFILSVKGIIKEKQELPLVDKIEPLLDNLTKILNPRGLMIRNITSFFYHLDNFMMQLNQGGFFSVLGSPALRSNLERITAQVNTLLTFGDDIINNNVRKILNEVSLLLNNVKTTIEMVNYNFPKLLSELNSIMFRLERMVSNLETSPIFGGGSLRQNQKRTRDQFFQRR